jgi:hypothetical protein
MHAENPQSFPIFVTGVARMLRIPQVLLLTVALCGDSRLCEVLQEHVLASVCR